MLFLFFNGEKIEIPTHYSRALCIVRDAQLMVVISCYYKKLTEEVEKINFTFYVHSLVVLFSFMCQPSA